MLSKKVFLFSLFSFLIIGSAVFLSKSPSGENLKTDVVNVTYESPVGHGKNDSLGGFLENVMGWLIGIIAVIAVLFMAIAGVIYITGGTSGNEQLASTGKKGFVVAILGLTLALAGPSMLRQLKDITLKDGETIPININEAKTLTEVVLTTLQFILSIVAVIAIIAMTVSGIMYLMAGAQITQEEKAKKALTASVVGFIMTGSALIIVEQIVNFFGYNK